jgi:hypothetical protein
MKKILFFSGGAGAGLLLLGGCLHLVHSSLADFVRFVGYLILFLLFLPVFYLIPAKASWRSRGRVIFWLCRVLVACCALAWSVAVFWPRHYGSPPLQKRADTRYWILPTGSTIAYTLLPGRGVKRPYPIIYLHGGPGGPVSGNVGELSAFAEDGYDVYLYDQIGGGLSGRLAHIRE